MDRHWGGILPIFQVSTSRLRCRATALLHWGVVVVGVGTHSPNWRGQSWWGLAGRLEERKEKKWGPVGGAGRAFLAFP